MRFHANLTQASLQAKLFLNRVMPFSAHAFLAATGSAIFYCKSAEAAAACSSSGRTKSGPITLSSSPGTMLTAPGSPLEGSGASCGGERSSGWRAATTSGCSASSASAPRRGMLGICKLVRALALSAYRRAREAPAAAGCYEAGASQSALGCRPRWRRAAWGARGWAPSAPRDSTRRRRPGPPTDRCPSRRPG